MLSTPRCYQRDKNWSSSHQKFLLPFSLFRFEKLRWSSLCNKIFKRLVSERGWDIKKTCHVMLVKRSHGDKWLHTPCIFNNGKEILVRRALKGFGELEVEKFSLVEREIYLYSSKCYDQARALSFKKQTNAPLTSCRVLRHECVQGSKPVGWS